MPSPDGSSSASMILVLLVLVVLSAFFSSTETAVSSVNTMRLKAKADKGDKKAKIAHNNSVDFDKSLSAILIGNNIVNMAAASISTLVATAILGNSGAAVATLGITIVVLIFGEILPKSFAKEHAEKFAIVVSIPLAFLRTVLTPIIWVLVQIKKLVTGRRTSAELNIQPSVTQEELRFILDTVEEEGVLQTQETEIMHSAIEFNNTTAQEILVPRVDMAALPITATEEEVIKIIVDGGYSRVPVFEGTTDNIIGAVYAKDVLKCTAKGTEIRLKRLLREVMYVYRTKKISSLLADFRKEKQHMAIVTDDYGGTLGLVTLEDVLEELVGEIWDETDDAQTDIIQIDDNVYDIVGDANIEEVLEELNYPMDDFDCEYSTVAGWVLAELEHIPNVGEFFEFGHLHVQVQQVQNKRIKKIRITIGKTNEE